MDQGAAAGHLGDCVVVASREQVCDPVAVGVVAEIVEAQGRVGGRVFTAAALTFADARARS